MEVSSVRSFMMGSIKASTEFTSMIISIKKISTERRFHGGFYWKEFYEWIPWKPLLNSVSFSRSLYGASMQTRRNQFLQVLWWIGPGCDMNKEGLSFYYHIDLSPLYWNLKVEKSLPFSIKSIYEHFYRGFHGTHYRAAFSGDFHEYFYRHLIYIIKQCFLIVIELENCLIRSY